MLEQQIEGQLDLFSVFNMIPPSAPVLSVGQTVYKVSLDVIEECVVDSIFDCPSMGGHGYTLSKTLGYDVIWDNSVDVYAFSNKNDAIRLSDRTSKQLSVIRKETIAPKNQRSWKHYDPDLTLGHGKPYEIYATISMIGEATVYVKDWMTYAFLHFFDSGKEADKFYRDSLKGIEKYYAGTDKEFIELDYQIPLIDMYKSTESLYADWRYAMMNGNPYLKERNV